MVQVVRRGSSVAELLPSAAEQTPAPPGCRSEALVYLFGGVDSVKGPRMVPGRVQMASEIEFGLGNASRHSSAPKTSAILE